MLYGSPLNSELFVTGTDHALYYWFNHSWEKLGGYLTSSPAAVSPVAGEVTVLVRGTDGALWYKATANGGESWSSWSSFGGQLLGGTGPAACMSGSKLAPECYFVTGTNNALYWLSGLGWKKLGGYLTSSPAAVSPVAGTINAFVSGTNGALYEKTTTNAGTSWSSWTAVGGI
jgi:hypothetical protein